MQIAVPRVHIRYKHTKIDAKSTWLIARSFVRTAHSLAYVALLALLNEKATDVQQIERVHLIRVQPIVVRSLAPLSLILRYTFVRNVYRCTRFSIFIITFLF